jgi:predicted alpha/beta-fold hydrolase
VNVPTLVVHADADPMVLAHTVRPTLERAPEILQSVWVAADRGGHVGFAPDLDLGFGGALGIEPQIMSWLARQ